MLVYLGTRICVKSHVYLLRRRLVHCSSAVSARSLLLSQSRTLKGSLQIFIQLVHIVGAGSVEDEANRGASRGKYLGSSLFGAMGDVQREVAEVHEAGKVVAISSPAGAVVLQFA